MFRMFDPRSRTVRPLVLVPKCSGILFIFFRVVAESPSVPHEVAACCRQQYQIAAVKVSVVLFMLTDGKELIRIDRHFENNTLPGKKTHRENAELYILRRSNNFIGFCRLLGQLLRHASTARGGSGPTQQLAQSTPLSR